MRYTLFECYFISYLIRLQMWAISGLSNVYVSFIFITLVRYTPTPPPIRLRCDTMTHKDILENALRELGIPYTRRDIDKEVGIRLPDFYDGVPNTSKDTEQAITFRFRPDGSLRYYVIHSYYSD